MKIYLRDQLLNPAFPAKCVIHHTGCGLPIELCDIPFFFNGMRVTGVKVSVTNANAVAAEVSCERRGSSWYALYSATNFMNYGFVSKGFKVTLVLKDDENVTHETLLALGDVEIRSSSATATAGTPASFYATKGGEVYVRSNVVGGIQHFVKQVMSYDPEIGWGADWTGDYVLDASGNFVTAV